MIEIDKILVKHFSGEASPEEEGIIEDWKKRNLKEYNALKEAWLNYDDTASHIIFNAEDAWQKVHAQIKSENRILSIFTKRSIKLGIAASLLLVVGFFTISKFWFSVVEKENLFVFEGQKGMVKSFILPDGSTVWLKQFSKLVYIESGKAVRNMSLNGEAFFEVKRDTTLPFVVNTLQGTVTVLGTSFNVNSTDSSSVVSVKTGLVKLASGETSVLLSPNETAYAAHLKISEVSSVDPNFLSWKTGEFEFRDSPLPEIIKSLNTYYDNRFECTNADLSRCKITTHFKNNSIEEIEQTILLICSDVSGVHKNNKVIFE